MVDINGKEWDKLEALDIQTILSEQEFDESFYFELKADEVSSKKIAKEISAFSNTFGGYIFIGISDDKKIDGCTNWNEQKIHTTIHDSITPTPNFDVKKFICEGKTMYVIKVEEGAEPPYITSSGKIYERLSSGSCTIKDSSKLAQIYNKKENIIEKMINKASIPPLTGNFPNVYGYIDIGFVLTPSNINSAYDIFYEADLVEISQKLNNKMDSFNLTRIGNSIMYTPGGLSTPNGQLPAHANNFIEIMADGSAKMRILLLCDAKDNVSVNMSTAITLKGLYKDTYKYVMGQLFPNRFVYAKKYESLTVLKQFEPMVYYSDEVIEKRQDLVVENERLLNLVYERRKKTGKDLVVTNDRIPKNGLYTIDRRNMTSWGVDYTTDSIIEELFLSQFVTMGIVRDTGKSDFNEKNDCLPE